AERPTSSRRVFSESSSSTTVSGMTASASANANTASGSEISAEVSSTTSSEVSVLSSTSPLTSSPLTGGGTREGTSRSATEPPGWVGHVRPMVTLPKDGVGDAQKPTRLVDIYGGRR